MFPCCDAHLSQKSRISPKFVYIFYELGIVFRDESTFFMFHDEFWPAIVCHDGRNSSSKRLKNDIAERVGMRRKNKCIENGEFLRKPLPT